MISFSILLLCLGSTKRSFFPDPDQCDKYYDCSLGKPTEKLCPDGLVFDYTVAPKEGLCRPPSSVQCHKESVLQPATSFSIECPRLNGLFQHQNPANCQDYYDCKNGFSTAMRCKGEQLFDESSGSCQLEHNTKRSGCRKREKTSEFTGFHCPRNGIFGHEDPTNCEEYYECVNGIEVKLRCPSGSIFTESTGSCQWEHTGIRTGCTVRKLAGIGQESGYTCPNTILDYQVALYGPYYQAYTGDCRLYYTCHQGGVLATLTSCPIGTLFNAARLVCDDPQNVSGCDQSSASHHASYGLIA